ncbi:glycosyltransferase [Microbulbifer elongatus]|uniref:glycosyltransferase n=1 Tax=Microbulbifer elongatus TaxID=86173 RepID=UPI001CFF2877|nr:glycosyltransferase [Microbulbifer elongatus]
MNATPRYTDAKIGLVVIGRNEGLRLVNCLASIDVEKMPVVYVDSGSTDGSKAAAKDAGCTVVDLDLSQPFTAGRARNEGFEKLIGLHPDLTYVQFLDGDCQLHSGWLEMASRHLTENPQVAIACGRRRETYPHVSIYNRLCDIEWNTPVGDAAACGGDFMVRKDAFQNAGGFNPIVIAGEEPEMCLRLRRSGWRISRIDGDMTLHDADMHRFSQYARRAERCGHAYAQAAAMHGRSEEKYQVRELVGILFWGLVFPVGCLLSGLLVNPLALVLFLAYPMQWAKITMFCVRRTKIPFSLAASYAGFLMAAKFFQVYGALKYFSRSVFSRDLTIIEYK